MDNVNKILQYLIPVSKNNIEIDDRTIECKVEKIMLSEKFFHVDGCAMCGTCCIPEYNVFVPFEYEAIMNCTSEYFVEYGLPASYLEELKEKTTASTHNVNGAEVQLYTFKDSFPTMYIPGKGKDRTTCHFMYARDDGHYVCGIHPVRSITCRMPHLRINHNKKAHSTSFCTMQYGRNWAIGCPVVFHEPENEEEFEKVKANNLEKIEYLNKVAGEMHVETYLPEVIEYVKKLTFDNYKHFLAKNILTTKDTTQMKVKKLF